VSRWIYGWRLGYDVSGNSAFFLERDTARGDRDALIADGYTCAQPVRIRIEVPLPSRGTR
jgi:hypothetical protein